MEMAVNGAYVEKTVRTGTENRTCGYGKPYVRVRKTVRTGTDCLRTHKDGQIQTGDSLPVRRSGTCSSHAARRTVARIERARAGRLSAVIWSRLCKSGKALNKSAHRASRQCALRGPRDVDPEPRRRQRTSERDRGTSVEVSGAQWCGGFL